MSATATLQMPPEVSIQLEPQSETARMPSPLARQRRPEELSSLAREVAFVAICSMGQMMFAMHLSQVFVNQLTFVEALGIAPSSSAWLLGAFTVANGVSVVISGSISDFVSPRNLACGAFVWLALWSLIEAFAVHPDRVALFFVSRAFTGVAVGTLCSASMSMLGRVYHPGMRKNRVFAVMGGMIPLGAAVGGVQGGALSAHLAWVPGSTAIIAAICVGASLWSIPPLPVYSRSLKHFDFMGATAAISGCACIIFGLTQGAPTHWTPYTYALVIAGFILLGVFAFIESRVENPLIDNRLWTTPGFLPLMASYFLGYGCFSGWHFFASRFLLTIQDRSPIITACCMLPVGVTGSIAAFIVGRLLHKVPGHYIMNVSMIAFATGPAFFLPQNASTSYWALSFPSFIVSTFGPDMSFAAVSIFITSNVSRSHQGAAGSLVMTAQNLSTAVFAALGDTIGESVSKLPSGELDLPALRAAWWLSLAAGIAGALICMAFVRIPKSEEKEHVQ